MTIERVDASVEPDVGIPEDAQWIEQELAALHPASFGWALACSGRDADLAEEVLQDVYFKVLDGRARFDRRSSLKTWLFGVIRMTAREHRRWSILRVLRGGRGDGEPSETIADGGRAPDSEAARANVRSRSRVLSRGSRSASGRCSTSSSTRTSRSRRRRR